VVSLAALLAVLERDNIDPGMAGLSLTYALNITVVLNWFSLFLSPPSPGLLC